MNVFGRLRDFVSSNLCRIWKSCRGFVPAFVLQAYTRNQKPIERFKRDFNLSYKELWDIVCRRRKRSPFEQGMLPRPGGRLQLEYFKWKDYGNIIQIQFLMMGSAIFLVLLLLYAPWLIYLVFLSMVVAVAITPCLMYRARMHELGYFGERAVGEELDKLGRPQWRIFHGFDTGYGDIDHIIVCPKGVFFVETKTLRKNPKKPEKLRLKNDAIWIVGEYGEGRELKSPDPIERTEHNARWLYRYLSNKSWVDEKGGKMPYIVRIFAFPGWKIESADYNKNLILCNSEDIQNVFAERKDRLNGEQIKNISAALEEKNRLEKPND